MYVLHEFLPGHSSCTSKYHRLWFLNLCASFGPFASKLVNHSSHSEPLKNAWTSINRCFRKKMSPISRIIGQFGRKRFQKKHKYVSYQLPIVHSSEMWIYFNISVTNFEDTWKKRKFLRYFIHLEVILVKIWPIFFCIVLKMGYNTHEEWNVKRMEPSIWLFSTWVH